MLRRRGCPLLSPERLLQTSINYELVRPSSTFSTKFSFPRPRYLHEIHKTTLSQVFLRLLTVLFFPMKQRENWKTTTGIKGDKQQSSYCSRESSQNQFVSMANALPPHAEHSTISVTFSLFAREKQMFKCLLQSIVWKWYEPILLYGSIMVP